MGRVESVCGHGGLPEVLKDVSQQENICSEIYIVVISDVPTVKGVPDLLRVQIVAIGNSLVAETTVEFVL